MVFVVTNSSKKANKRNISCFSLKKKTHFFKLLDLSKKKTRSASNFPKCGINKVKSYLINIFNIQVNVIRAKILKKKKTIWKKSRLQDLSCNVTTMSGINSFKYRLIWWLNSLFVQMPEGNSCHRLGQGTHMYF